MLGSLSAQTFVGKISPYTSAKTKSVNADTLKILAVMVSFQEDRDGATFGNGKFGSIYSKNYGSDILDPLPHDKDYFESHLTFAKNYFEKVSKGKVNLSFTVLPDTFSVSKTMRNYSPASNSTDFTPLGQFAQEVWSKADQLNPGFNFSDYDIFLIFHAGVGRDITLPGSLGNERDLPSVYLNESAFKNIFGQDYQGIQVSNGSFNILNSMIIPETESRELETISGKFLFEITINGLLVASIASHLGLPDLFDTETGLSAIGRFGLMDGQAIFAYNGVFPPEPSAWEKIYLGWAESVESEIGNFDVSIAANLTASLSDTVILKVPINSSEYYLIENRQRDEFIDGSKITFKSNGNIFTKTFPKDTTGFYSFNTDSLSGVILDVDEFDWALPGNGIVIWHIDENVINEKLAENKINTDKTRRGVDVEEADGIQDIGEQFTTIFGDNVIGEGTDQDFWYSGNKAKLYKNIFSKDTRPDTKTNTGANSLITIKNFSSISNKMSFKIEYGDSIVKPLFISDLSQPNVQPAVFTSLTTLEQFALSNSAQLFAVLSNNNSLFINDFEKTRDVVQNFSEFKVININLNNRLYILGSIGNKINIISFDETYPFSGLISQSVILDYQITAPLVLKKNTDNNHILFVGYLNGSVYEYDLQSILNENPVILDSHPGVANQIVKQISVIENEFSFITVSSLEQSNQPGTYADRYGYQIFENEFPITLALTKDNQNNIFSIVLTSANNIYLMKGYNTSSWFKIKSDISLNSFSLADLKNDGNNYIIINNGNIETYNLQGALAENFPFSDPNGIGFSGTPLIADIEGDSKSEIISQTSDGRIFALDGGTGKIVDGFPISTGTTSLNANTIFDNEDQLVFSSLTSSQINGWVISSISGKVDWAEIYGNNLNHSSLGNVLNTNTINDFFPTNRAYNYPNPAYNGQTAIRYYVGEDSKISIKIFDLSGDLVAELNNDAAGGFDNETIWNVGNIQSGVYLARIEAAGSSGKTESVIIKIAVVK
jgi:hypothetical protein